MDLSTRFVHIAGVTTSPNGAFMQQIACNLSNVSDSFLLNKTFLIMDRDKKYMDAFRAYLKREGVTLVLCPVRAPNCNAFAERFVRSVKSECLDRLIAKIPRSRRWRLTKKGWALLSAAVSLKEQVFPELYEHACA